MASAGTPAVRPFVDLSTVLADATGPRDWFAEGALEGNPLVLLAGPEKSGKSWILVDLAVATASGQPWLGKFAVQRPGDVVVYDGEYGEHEYARRLARVCRGRGLDPHGVLPRIRYVYSAGVGLDRRDRTLANLVDECNADRIRPALIILDPLANHLPEGADENSAKDVLGALGVASFFRDGARCPFVLSHHLNRQGAYAGSRRLRTRCDLILEGSDEDQPWYSAKGRTIRSGDRIASRFTVSIRHESDGDDAVAATFLTARFVGETGRPRAALGKTTLRVLDELRRAGQAVSQTHVATAAKLSSPATRKALDELRSAGLAEKRDGVWALTLTELGERLAERRDQGRSIDPPDALTPRSAEPQKIGRVKGGQEVGSDVGRSRGSLPVGETRLIDPPSERMARRRVG